MQSQSVRFGLSRYISGWAVLFAAAVACSVWLGQYVSATVFGLEMWLPQHSSSMQVLAVCGIFALTYALCILLFLFLDKLPRAETLRRGQGVGHQKQATVSFSAGQFPRFLLANKKLLLVQMLIILVCWAPCLIARFPGNIDPDTLHQLLQTAGLAQPNDINPWFDTLVFSAFWKLGGLFGSNMAGICAYAALQTLAAALVFSLAGLYARFVHAPKGLAVAVVAFAALFPAIPAFAQAMMKDSLFSLMWAFFLIGYCELLRTRGEVLRDLPQALLFVFLALLVMLTKKTGVYILLLLAMPLLTVATRAQRTRVLTCLLVPVLVFFCYSKLLLPAAGIEGGKSREMMSVPSQQVAYYLTKHENEMTAEDWDVLSAVYTNPQNLAELYTPGRADATKYYWKEDASTGERLRFLVWYVQKGAEDPASYAVALAALDLPLYYPDALTQDDESLIFYRDNIPTETEGFGEYEAFCMDYTYSSVSAESVRELFGSLSRADGVGALSSAYDGALQAVMNACPVLFSKALYAWFVPLFVLCYCLHSRRVQSGVALVYLAPSIVVFLTLVVGPIVLPRYMATVLFALPFLLLAPVLARKG